MVKINKKKAAVFAAAFAGTVLVVSLLVFVVFKGMFYKIYTARGDSSFAAGDYTQAVKYYNTAKGWNPKKQQVYLALAKAYGELEDFESAGAVLDEAIEKKLTTERNRYGTALYYAY